MTVHSPSRPAVTHLRVADWATRTPEATAVVDGTRTLSYAELDRRTNRLAHLLREHGVGPEVLVGVCLERGFDLVVALLAVWRAGGAYVPLDPRHPAERRDWILRDTRAAVLLTRHGLRGAATAAETVQVLCLDTERSRLAGYPTSAPEVVVEPENAAYAIYTSGSTGRPKGAVITHAGIANRISWTVARHGLSPADRVIQKTSLSFDAAGWEFFGPLVSGGTVVLAPPGAEQDPATLVKAINEHEVTVLQGVPSVLRLLAEEPGWGKCGSLRLIFSAGEPLHAELCQRLTGALPARMWNTYGPTECSIDVTAHEVDPDQHSGAIPIGRPIDNISVRVLDPDGVPVPVGVLGELHVGGVGLGRGYLGRPDLTAERFVPDEYGEPGARLYRTGDLVRWRADGTLEYAGRADAQLKVNGVRIEPGEIEAALAEHPDVRGSAVVGFTDRDGETRLAAYLLADPAPTASQLRAFLVERLPEALVPAVFTALPAFPLTTSGKVDRAALPPVDTALVAPGYLAPRTRAEQIVAEAWQDLLGVDQVGVHDDFFQLGGSSLVLTRLANRLSAQAAGKIALRRLFTASTVEEQARLFDEAPSEGVPLRPAPRPADGMPLSFAQQRLWFLDQMRPGNPEWMSPLFLRLPSTVDPETVRRALEALQARHEVLRTRFVAGDTEPRQVILPPGEVEFRVAAGDLVTLFREEFGKGFDLRDGPVWRALLVPVPGEDHVLLVTAHHIVSDGWTSVVLDRDLRELCAALAADREPRLPALPVQYADYAVWQRAQLTDEVVDRELGYWRQALSGLPRLDLPTDRPRPAQRDSTGAGVRVDLPAELTTALAELGRRHGATPFMTLLTGYATVLARYTGQWDVPVGTPVAGRPRPELEQVAGLFLNPLVLRCGLSPRLTFTEALARVRDTATAAFAHQELPFERIVEALVPERDLSRTPLYQVALDLQEDGRTSVVRADPTAMDAFQRAAGVAKTDLTLYLWSRPDGGITGAFEYATALFDESTVRRLAGHLVRLLTSAVADPLTRLGALELLAPAEREQLVHGFNATAAPAPTDTVLDRFERQAARTPQAPAVRHGATATSYADLEAGANRFAHRLRAAGVGPGSVVAVLLERGVPLLAALLGVWKAGGAYLPLDPSSPPERVDYMLSTAGVAVAVTDSAHADRFSVPALLIDRHTLMVGAEADTPPARGTDPGELAYLIFTSGSTGRPKGVMISHEALATYLGWAADTYLAETGVAGSALFSSVAFDLVVTNLWAPLTVGRPVTVLPRDLDPASLGRELAAAGPYAFLKLTPGHLELLGEQLTDAQAAALAPVVAVGGEALTGALATRWRDLLGPGKLINEYGPTEATVAMAIHPVVARPAEDPVPIGLPTAGATMHVLDPGLRPQPVGVPGELCIGGRVLARGYVNRPDLTAERFLPDPFGPAGSRLYRTGDLAVRGPDGTVTFLGRIDDQVKIRGYRVEPGEVRAVLEEHPAVRAAVVVAHRERLVAYVVGDIAGLAEHCARRLPDYLVPSLIIPVEAIPLTVNGKVDRAALPDPDSTVDTEELVAPRTVVEERIAAIWTELLGVPVGVTQSFFSLGGHSIRAVRLIARLQEEFEVDLPIRLVFEHPTVAALAQAVEDEIRAEIAALADNEVQQ